MIRSVLTALVLFALCIPAAIAAERTPDKFIVHEWGTFTGLAGADGRHLPFRAAVGAHLPSFVLTRDEQADRFDPSFNAAMMRALTKDETYALVRMETPVVYFYTNEPREVEARVEFPQGMLTEFYPPVRAMTPAYDAKDARSVLGGTSLDWGKFRIVPQSVSANYPKIDEGTNHYAHARDTDAASVQWSDRPGEVHEENFLFYRGLGDFHLPVSLVARGRDHFVLRNSTGVPISTAFLIRTDRGANGGTIRFATYRNIAGQQRMTLPPPSHGASESPADAMAKALVAEGLYEKEAWAMVRTWESSWFGSEGTGTRVLYMLPRRTTDAVLPLHIKPTPDETVRVLVGRIDVLTPEQEAKLASLFSRAGMKGAITGDEAREAKSLGRFMLPALRRAAEQQMWDVTRALNQAEHAATTEAAAAR
jgi:hypothetical protein